MSSPAWSTSSPCSPGGWAAPSSCRVCCTARAGRLPGVAADAEVTVIANTADDLWVHGLKVCPDLDTVMYTLGDGIDPERGWGRRDETWSVKEELAAYGVEPTWFGLGDRDIATHLVRTQMLDAGYPLSEVTEALCRRWQPRGERPAAADDRRPGRDARRDRRRRSRRAAAGSCTSRSTGCGCAPRCPPRPSWSSGSTTPRPAPGVIDAITDADLVILPPSNPVVSVGTILGVPRVREALRRHQGAGRRPLPHRRRHATCAAWPSSCSPRSASRSAPPASAGTTAPGPHGGVLDGWLVDEADADQRRRAARGRAGRGRRTADDDRPRRHRRDGGRRRSGWSS